MKIIKYKLAILTSHSIQYQAPFFRKLASHPAIDLTVYFCWDFGMAKDQLDPGFGMKLKWDIPLLEGYKYKFLPNISPKPSTSFFGQINPTVIKELWVSGYDAILIHGYSTLSTWLAFLGAGLKGTQILLRGAIEPYAYRPIWKRGVKRLILRPLFKRIAAFLLECKLHVQYYKRYGAEENKIFIVPSAVDNDRFQKLAQEFKPIKDQLKKDLKYPEVPIILFLNKLIPRKRPMDLLRAFEIISEEIKVSLVFVGEGKERISLESYIKEKNIKNVFFAGFKNQSEIGIYYSIADVFVLPSQNDASPKSLNEALNFGLPVIVTTGVGTAPELVKNGENGFIYPPGDINALCECLLKILGEPENAKAMGQCSLEIVSKYNYDECVNEIVSALEFLSKKRD